MAGRAVYNRATRRWEQVEVVDEEPEHPVVVSFDPGVSTGWSVIQVHRDALDPKLGNGYEAGDCKLLDNILLHSFGTLNSGGTDDGECRVAHLMMDIVVEWPFAAVVLEDFILRMMSSDRALLSPVRMNSRLEVLMYNNKRQWVKRLPSEAKTAVSDERLRNWGFTLSSVTHENDATRHGVNLLKTAKFKPDFAYKLWKPLWESD